MNKYIITDPTGQLSFEYDKDFGLMVSYTSINEEYCNPNISFDLTNQSDINKIQNLITYIEHLDINTKSNNNDYYTLSNTKIIIGCNCIGGIIEHSLLLDKTDEYLTLVLYMSPNDTILLGKEQSTFFINYLQQYIGQTTY